MGLLRRALQKRRGRRDFGPPMGRPRMVPNIPAPIPPLEPFERLPFDDPRNDFMSIQRIEDVGVPGITPIEPVMPPPIPLPIPPVLPQPIIQQPLIGDTGPISNLDLRIRQMPSQLPVDPRKIPQRPPSIGGIGGISAVPQEPIELETGPVTIGGPKDLGGVGPTPGLNVPQIGNFNLEKMPLLPKRDDFMSIGGPGGGLSDLRQVSQIGREIGAPGTGTPPPPTTPAPTTPAAVADDVGAVPPTTIPADTRGQIDPVLAQQDAREVLSDPLLRALYFGTADQPGFINQLQQATQNVMGAELPSTQFDPNMTQQFFNPFEDRVVQQTIQDVMDFGEKQDVAARARDIQTGGLSAFGSRARLTADERREALGRGLAESLSGIRQSGFSEAQRAALGQFRDQYESQMGQINRPIDLLTTVGRSLPGYGAQQTVIDSQYRLPVDPTAAGLGAAFNTYSALKPGQTPGI